MRLLFIAKCLVLAICFCLLCGVVLWLRLTATEIYDTRPRAPRGDKLIKKLFGHLLPTAKPALMSHEGDSVRTSVEKQRRVSEVERSLSEDSNLLPDYNVHVFYYMWYCNPRFDGEYLHWNHPYLPHWNKNEDKKWPKGRHEPPEDIGSSFYPTLGAYSSQNHAVVLEKHVADLPVWGR